MTPLPSSLKIRTAKSWQGKEATYVFQASFSGIKKDDQFVKKFFVLIDLRQASFGVYLLKEKPTNLALQGGMVNAMRKYCRSATIGAIQKDESNGDLWLTLYSSSEIYYLLAQKSRPPQLSLIDATGLVLMRFGMKGTFTKKQQYGEALPSDRSDDFTHLLTTYASAFKSTLAQDEEESAENSDELPEDEELLVFSKQQRNLLQKLRRKRKTFLKALEKQEKKLPSKSLASELHHKGSALQSFAYLHKEGEFQLEIPGEISGYDEDLVIDIDPDKKLGANIEDYFVKAKKAERSYMVGEKMIASNKRDLSKLDKHIEQLATQQETAELDRIAAIYQIRLGDSGSLNKSKQDLVPTSKPYKEFTSQSGHRILVGKGPKENDELTKSAKANDFWLHSAGVAGSHIIVPKTKMLGQSLPEDLLKEASILAIHYSKYKGDMAGEVYLAKRSEIKKQKGMPPGLWNVERCKTVFIRYEQSDLNKILNQMTK